MPEWLFKKDNYIPPKDKDAFIDKSILSILKVLGKFYSREGEIDYKVNINGKIKVLSLILIIILLSLSRNLSFILTIGVGLLVIVSLLSPKDIRYIIKMGVIAGGFTFIILLPSIYTGNKNNSMIIVLKVLETVTAVNIVSCTTKWNQIIGSLKLFFIPDIFIFVLDITIKYILILGEFSLNMLYALKLRSIGKGKDKTSSLSGIIGTLFIKSKEMSEEMQGAMECRGFTGEYKVYDKSKLHYIDYAVIIVDIIIWLCYFFC